MNGEYFIRTYTGKYFDLEHPNHQDIDLRDIAYSLSHICRFTGHAGAFTVAEHSINVSNMFTDPRIRLAALLHDAAEAYVGDISTHLKRLLKAGPIEDKILQEIEKAFGVEILNDCEIKQIDRAMLLVEARDLMGADINDGFWAGLGEPLPHFRIDHRKVMSHKMAEMRFIKTYTDIQDEFVKGF